MDPILFLKQLEGVGNCVRQKFLLTQYICFQLTNLADSNLRFLLGEFRIYKYFIYKKLTLR